MRIGLAVLNTSIEKVFPYNELVMTGNILAFYNLYNIK